DDTPRRMGHLSLNPFRHMDQYGVLLLFISVFASGGNSGFAYGFTPVNERALRPNPKLGGGIVAAVGPLSNLVLAGLLAIPLRLSLLDTNPGLFVFVARALFLNVFLAIFNLVPLPPLDGWRVLATFLSPRTLYDLRGIAQYGPFILLALFLFEPYLHFFGWINASLVIPISRVLAPNLSFF
ncbi:MAG TPA: site-2 protease family protein, partial [Chloroflexota bacterium]|nr:site-2 protease family protein [Chloroflexota bacterium]